MKKRIGIFSILLSLLLSVALAASLPAGATGAPVLSGGDDLTLGVGESRTVTFSVSNIPDPSEVVGADFIQVEAFAASAAEDGGLHIVGTALGASKQCRISLNVRWMMGKGETSPFREVQDYSKRSSDLRG